jgi:hypothetical protein
MRKKPASSPWLFVPDSGQENTVLNWHSVPGGEFRFYARSFHTAAKALARTLDLDSGSPTDIDACPVVFLYRHALELHLKTFILGHGGNLLPTKPDQLSIYKTHSLSWLAQFVCQIVTALRWEREFKSEGIEKLADFKAIIEELNSVDPGSHASGYPVNKEGQGSVPSRLTFSVHEFAHRTDAVLDLLAGTADALAARREGLAAEAESDGGYEIQ